MKRRIFSVILALCLCVALLPVAAMAADNSPTRDEAVKWLYDQEGVWHDLDNKYGAQCSDFVSAYMNWLYSGNTNPYQGYAVYNASYYPTVAGWNTGRWAVYSNISSFAPEPGDIYVQSAHVGVFLAGSKSRATVIDQNSWETWALAEENAAVGRAGRIYDTSITDATHFIRYKNFSTAAITPTVTFTAWENSSYTYIRETDAAIGQQIDISGGTCTKTGMILYDNNRKELGRAENPSYTEHRVFFKVNEELGVTLSPGTTYQYRFWAAVNGKIYYSDYKSFKTSGTANIAVTGISVNKTTLSLKTGETASLTATVSPSNATDKTVTWSSSNTKVATMSGGKVTAVAAGTATITPALVQNEIHPYYQEQDVVPFIQEKGIVVQCWYPLGGRGYTADLLGNETIKAIAEAHGVSSAQVILRWDLQRGIVVIPGSSNPDHIRENLDLFGFELTDDEMAEIGELDRGEKHDWY